MKILILNWRDIKNPSSGGAEILTHEIAKYLVSKNNQVILLTSRFEGSLATEEIDGIRVIRVGQSIARYFFNSVHFLAFKKYKSHFEGKIDLVIDEVHGIPFFTPWYVKEKKIVLVCEVAGDLWIRMFGIIIGTLGRIIEIFYLRVIYKNTPFITISNSVKNDLIKNGVDKKNISVISIGVDIPRRLPVINREKIPTIVFLGRVSRSKGVEDAILVLKKLSKKHEVKMWVCGRYERSYMQELEKIIKAAGVSSKIKFFGYVTYKEKFNLISRSWILIHPSKTEGWGINIIEANSLGVPAVGYNVPGLQDSIKDNETGLLTKNNTVDGLVDSFDRLLTDKELYRKLSEQSILWSKNFTWEKTGEETWRVLKEVYNE